MEDATSLQKQLQEAVALHRAGKLDEAEAQYRRLLAHRPGNPEVLHLLGIIDMSRGRMTEAIENISRAIAANPNNSAYHSNLGIAFGHLGRIDHSAECFRRAIQLKPDYADAWSNLAIIHSKRGDIDAAIEAATSAIRLDPRQVEAYINLSFALSERGRLDDAITAARHAIRVSPNRYEAHNNLAKALYEKGELQQAADICREALKLKPDAAPLWNNLASCLKDLGQISQAIECYRRAAALAPDPGLLSNLIFAMNFSSDLTPQEIAAERALWVQRFADPLKPTIVPPTNDANPSRRLRIGYVSPDFRWHPVGRFMAPLLSHHSHEHFEIFCYASVSAPDQFTARLRQYADRWIDIRAMSDAQAAEKIREDRIDILIDLAMHGASNRLPIFARKPAPIQVTYLAYPGTTGLPTIDYRITDPHLDPPDAPSADYSEKSIYLPSTYWCYEPSADAREISPLPAESAGYITFGCLNNFCKVSPLALQAWREILAAVPDSHLLLHTAPGPHRDKILADFAAAGIASGRIRFTPFLQPAEYFRHYSTIDIALDPFPAAGGTTTFDALWMGVPVITLRGKTALARGGASILSNLGLTDWIANDIPEYVSLAKKFAADIPCLADLRNNLRETLRNSPLMNATQFAADMESLYRKIWTDWCATRP